MKHNNFKILSVMKKSILILSGCVGMLCLSLLSACSKDEEGTNPPDDGGGDNEEEVVDGDDEEDAVLTLSLDSITVDSGAGRQTVELTSNNEWEIDNPSSEWISISPSQGQAWKCHPTSRTICASTHST